MTLAAPLPGGRITQLFGPSVIGVEPSAWYDDRLQAYWNSYPGADGYSVNVHMGVDFSGMPAGSSLVAAEAGIVSQSYYDKYNGGGNVVEVTIRPNVKYSYNHCQARLVGVGAHVTKGQRIATVGATGTLWTGTQFIRSAYATHVHVNLLHRYTWTDGVARTMLLNFADYMAGGRYANSALVVPDAPPVYAIVKVKPGFNIRSTPDLDVGPANIAYVSRPDGIYTVKGTRVAPITTGFQRRGMQTNDDGTWITLYGFNRILYITAGGIA